MGKHAKPKTKGRHVKPADNKPAKKVATFSAAAVSVPTLALTFTPSAQAAQTGNIPRIMVPEGGDVATPSASASASEQGTPEACADYIVKRGDTLSGVAYMYGVPLADLKPLNPGIIAGDRPDDYSLIFAGGHVHLPAGSCDVVNEPPAPSAGHVHTDDCDHGQDGASQPPAEQPQEPSTPAPDEPEPPAADPTGFTPVIAPDCPGTASGYCAHSVSYWEPLIEQAKNLVGVQGYSTSAIKSLMLAESSGNPNVVNNWDSNAANGTPSKGLMQTIQPTFDAYHVAGTSSNIYDPLANIAAALNYIKHVYGYVPNSPY